MPIQAAAWEDQIESVRPPIPVGFLLLICLGPLLFLPLAWALGWVQMGIGNSPGAPAALISMVLYGLGLHGFLVWPLCGYVFPDSRNGWGTLERMRFVLLLFSPPLLSFLSFRSGSGLTDLWELAMTVVPSLILGALLFERSKRPWVFSLSLTFSTSLPWLWLGDRLGGFSPVFVYGVLSSDFQVLRVLGIALVIVFAAIWFTRSFPVNRLWLRGAGRVLLVLLGVHLALGTVAPFIGSFLGAEAYANPHWPLVTFPWLILGCLRPERARGPVLSRLALLVAAAEVASLAYQTVVLRADVWGLSQWFAAILSTATAVYLSWTFWASPSQSAQRAAVTK